MGERLLPRVGISQCLLGQPVRYDGNHRARPDLLDGLGPFVSWVPVCPEFELGMGVPREPVRLVGDPHRPGMAGVESAREWGPAMRGWAQRRVGELLAAGLDGFVLKARSPSCSPSPVDVHDDGGQPAGSHPGLFAAALRQGEPSLPVADEESLATAPARAAFLERCREHARRRAGHA